jgi:hypothetical protein
LLFVKNTQPAHAEGWSKATHKTNKYLVMDGSNSKSGKITP